MLAPTASVTATPTIPLATEPACRHCGAAMLDLLGHVGGESTLVAWRTCSAAHAAPHVHPSLAYACGALTPQGRRMLAMADVADARVMLDEAIAWARETRLQGDEPSVRRADRWVQHCAQSFNASVVAYAHTLDDAA